MERESVFSGTVREGRQAVEAGTMDRRGLTISKVPAGPAPIDTLNLAELMRSTGGGRMASGGYRAGGYSDRKRETKLRINNQLGKAMDESCSRFPIKKPQQ